MPRSAFLGLWTRELKNRSWAQKEVFALRLLIGDPVVVKVGGMQG